MFQTVQGSELTSSRGWLTIRPQVAGKPRICAEGAEAVWGKFAPCAASAGGMLPIDSRRRRLLNQSTQGGRPFFKQEAKRLLGALKAALLQPPPGLEHNGQTGDSGQARHQQAAARQRPASSNKPFQND
jgi:hypothetical protein